MLGPHAVRNACSPVQSLVACAFLAVSTMAREPIKQALAGRLVFEFLPAPSHGRGQRFESPALHDRPSRAVCEFDS